jgi:hypothetical protein
VLRRGSRVVRMRLSGGGGRRQGAFYLLLPLFVLHLSAAFMRGTPAARRRSWRLSARGGAGKGHDANKNISSTQDWTPPNRTGVATGKFVWANFTRPELMGWDVLEPEVEGYQRVGLRVPELSKDDFRNLQVRWSCFRLKRPGVQASSVPIVSGDASLRLRERGRSGKHGVSGVRHSVCALLPAWEPSQGLSGVDTRCAQVSVAWMMSQMTYRLPLA